MSDTTHDATPASGGHGFGTTPVFLAGISTILGAIMFLRFGYAVGNVGLFGALMIVVIGHMVTVPTALAIAEIATNRKVEGGGEYFIISRSFGTTIGSVIGISLYLSQAISVAFYMIAFAEAFEPLRPQIEELIGGPFDPRYISLPSVVALIVLMLTKGADLGVKALYVVVAVLVASLALFFLGSPVAGYDVAALSPTQTVASPDNFFIVFAICFPAFTGMTAGVGLSGDLANPRKSIPQGTLLATVAGFVMYIAIISKLWMSAPLDDLASDQLIMGKIALWGPIIPIGLACATLSSALGSILVAPRTLQAIGADRSLPSARINSWLEAGVGSNNEPRNTTIITGVLAIIIVLAGNVDFVARLISMFFMVTYGALCAISFLEHFAARPSYRPSFRSRWWVSLFGAAMCLFMMFQMDPVFAILALVLMVVMYIFMSRTTTKQDDLAAMFQGVIGQATRYMQVNLQRQSRAEAAVADWRPSVIMVNARTFDRRAPLEFMRWLCQRYGFGTYLHFIQGQLDAEAYEGALEVKDRLIKLARVQNSPVYMDTIVSPSLISALAQSLQVPGVSGLNNNAVMFEFSRHDDEDVVSDVTKSLLFASNTDMAMLVLRHGDFHFGEHRNIHIWITWNDQSNANLMILLGYILLDHPAWRNGELSVFAALPSDEIDEQRSHLQEMLSEGRIPISEKNVRFFAVNNADDYANLVEQQSADADLTIMGFELDTLRSKGSDALWRHKILRDVLFVRTARDIVIN